MNPYDFKRFLKRMAGKDRNSIIAEASEIVEGIRDGAYGRPGAVRDRRLGAVEFAEKVGEFLFIVRTETRPAMATPEDLRKYRPVAERLVVRGEMRPSVVDLLKSADE